MKDLEKRALEYATLKHKGVYRKGKNHEPYINHPVRVAELVKKYKGDSKEIEFLVKSIPTPIFPSPLPPEKFYFTDGFSGKFY